MKIEHSTPFRSVLDDFENAEIPKQLSGFGPLGVDPGREMDPASGGMHGYEEAAANHLMQLYCDSVTALLPPTSHRTLKGLVLLPFYCPFWAHSGAFPARDTKPRKKPQPLYLQRIDALKAGGGGGNRTHASKLGR
jgi:hypothetical protein